MKCGTVWSIGPAASVWERWMDWLSLQGKGINNAILPSIGAHVCHKSRACYHASTRQRETFPLTMSNMASASILGSVPLWKWCRAGQPDAAPHSQVNRIEISVGTKFQPHLLFLPACPLETPTTCPLPLASDHHGYWIRGPCGLVHLHVPEQLNSRKMHLGHLDGLKRLALAQGTVRIAP